MVYIHWFTPIIFRSFSRLFFPCHKSHGTKRIHSSRPGSFLVLCALHPLYRALHSSKRFDCSSKWGVTAEMVLIKKRWTSLEAKLLQPHVSLKALARRVKSLCIINNLSKSMPNGNGGQGEEEKKGYKNRSCLGPLRCMDGGCTQGGESRATFYSHFRSKTIETLHI